MNKKRIKVSLINLNYSLKDNFICGVCRVNKRTLRFTIESGKILIEDIHLLPNIELDFEDIHKEHKKIKKEVLDFKKNTILDNLMFLNNQKITVENKEKENAGIRQT